MRTATLFLLLATACAGTPALDLDAPFRDATRAHLTAISSSAGGRFVDIDDRAELRSFAAGFLTAQHGGPNHGASPRFQVVFERGAGERVVVLVWPGSWETFGVPFWGGRLHDGCFAALEQLLAGPRAQTPPPPPPLPLDEDGFPDPLEMDLRPIVIDRENTWPWPVMR